MHWEGTGTDLIWVEKWPKQRPKISETQQAIIDLHGTEWESSTSGNLGFLEDFNHTYLANNCRMGGKTLEIGCGSGDQIPYEVYDEYHALDIRLGHIKALLHKYSHVCTKATVGDCEKKIPYRANTFDKVLAIHVLEHLLDLHEALREVHRVLKPNGEFGIIIPCEGGLVRKLACKFDVKRLEQRKFGIEYDCYLRYEHCNNVWEIIEELDELFTVKKQCYFPFMMPVAGLNLKLGLVLTPR